MYLRVQTYYFNAGIFFKDTECTFHCRFPSVQAHERLIIGLGDMNLKGRLQRFFNLK